MFNLDNYLKRPDALSLDQALAIYNQIPYEQAQNDGDFKELWQDIIDAALDYVPIRVRWNDQNTQERAAVDAGRTRRHNAFISSLKILNRYTATHYDAEWLSQLGTPVTDRKRIGDFAGYIVLFGVLKGR
ncbi:DUF3232 domain-containing protein [Lacticaseibacillus camelliae]|nr:DUF3232 domain-containing protein [Lacticaseibacillus camelliae]